MDKKTFVASTVVIVVVCLSVSAFFYCQISSLQTQKDQLTRQATALQEQNSTLQAQLAELQLQNREQQERLSDYTLQLVLQRHLNVEIIGAYCSGGWSPLGGVTVSYPANATIANRDVVPLYGLVISFRFVDRDSGRQIGEEMTIKVDRINAGESKVAVGSVLASLNTNVDNAVCKIVLSKGDIVLDQWTQELN